MLLTPVKRRRLDDFSLVFWLGFTVAFFFWTVFTAVWWWLT